MLTDKDGEKLAPRVIDRIELDEFVKPQDRTHHDRYAQQSHELPNEAAEASSRMLIRGVPLAYGAMLGSLAGSLFLGLTAGALLSLAFDLNMGQKSMARALFRSLCPAIVRAGHLLARLIRRLGLEAPAALVGMRCRGPRF